MVKVNPSVRKFFDDKLPFIMRIVAAARYQSTKRKIQHILKERREVSIELGSGMKKGQGEWLTMDLTSACDECKRVLVPGGKFLICVPNAKLFLDAYANGVALDPSYFHVVAAYNRTTLIDCVNYMAYMDGNHQYMFDEENLQHLLRAKGFRDVGPRPFDPRLDDPGKDNHSIYAQAEK